MRRFATILALTAGLAAAQLPGHAFTRIAGCEGLVASTTFSATCTVVFNAPVHTINLRAVPEFDFAGTIMVEVTQGAVGYAIKTVWATGRVQIAGDAPLTIQLAPYQQATLRVYAGRDFVACVDDFGLVCSNWRRAVGHFAGQVDV